MLGGGVSRGGGGGKVHIVQLSKAGRADEGDLGYPQGGKPLGEGSESYTGKSFASKAWG